MKGNYAGFPITETFLIIKISRVLKPKLTGDMEFINTASSTLSG